MTCNSSRYAGNNFGTAIQFPDLVNPFGLMAAHDAFRKLETTATVGPFYAGITGYGDSMATPNDYVIADFGRALQLRYGLGGIFTPGLGQTWLSAVWSLAGGATQETTDYTYFPGSGQINMPVASTADITTGLLKTSSSRRDEGAYPLEMDQGGGLILAGFKTVRCLYLTRPGDGTLTFTVSQTGVADNVSAVSCDAALGLSYVDIDVDDNSIGVTLNATATVAQCVFVGAVFLRESGVLLWSSQVGGSTMEDQNEYIRNGNVSGVYTQLSAALSTALFVHSQRVPGDANWQANYGEVFDALSTIPATSQLVLGEPPRTTESDPTVATINAFLLKESNTRGLSFFDQNYAMGSSNVNMISLSWEGDGVHLAAPAHRYLSGKILESVDWFRMGVNKMDIDPLTMGQLLKRVVELNALLSLHTSTITARVGDTLDGGSVAGAYSGGANTERGFFYDSTAALGHIASRIGVIITENVAINTSEVSVYSSIVGYRNLNLKAGLRAFLLFGVSATTVTTLVGLNQRCYGIECALGSDVGSPSGVTTEVVRLLSSDGSTITYGGWIDARFSGGSDPTSSGGMNLVISWNKDDEVLSLYKSDPSNASKLAVLSAPDLASNNTSGAWVNMTLLAEDGGNIPVATGAFSIREIKTSFNPELLGISNNNLIGAV